MERLLVDRGQQPPSRTAASGGKSENVTSRRVPRGQVGKVIAGHHTVSQRQSPASPSAILLLDQRLP